MQALKKEQKAEAWEAVKEWVGEVTKGAEEPEESWHGWHCLA